MPLKSSRKATTPLSSLTLKGKVSWFGGPKDGSDSGHTALGLTTATPGIAVYNEATLGGYWNVTFPNGRKKVLRQTDIGPAPWTNRVVDVTYSALASIGYSESNFPTDSEVTAEYLGKDKESAETKAGENPVEKVEGSVTGEPKGEQKDAGLIEGILGGGIGGKLAEDFATANASDAALRMGEIGISIIRDVGVGFVDLIIAPAWHWNQRTVATYTKFVLGNKEKPSNDSTLQWALPWTAAFWGLGYALLWTDIGSGTGLKPVAPHKSVFSRHVRRSQSIPARRQLLKPRNVKKNTPTKPKPTESKAAIVHVNIMTAERPRTVRIGNSNARNSTSQGVTSEAPIRRVKLESDGTIKRVHPKPDTAARTGEGAHKDSGDTSKAAKK